VALERDIATRLKRAGWIARTLATDLRYGAILSGNVGTRYRQAGAYNVVNTPYAVLPQIFAGRIGRDDVLVDVGCGKGRVINWWLSRGLRNRMYGIEIDPEVAAATRRRLRRFGNVTIITGDATSSVPDEATLLYMYNPFDEAAVVRLKENLAERFFARGITMSTGTWSGLPPSRGTRRRGGKRTESDRPDRGIRAGRLADCGVELVQDSDGSRQQSGARRREDDAVSAAVEQPTAGDRLERRHLPRDGRLRVAQRACRRRERAQLRDLAQHTQAGRREIVGHAYHACYPWKLSLHAWVCGPTVQA
jgi:SAM-dependent methyltransferase